MKWVTPAARKRSSIFRKRRARIKSPDNGVVSRDLDIEAQPSAPIVWTIAGSDSGGGAGIQVDLKVMSAFGVHGCSAITALTAQNTLGVESIEPVPAPFLRRQLQALSTDLPPAVVKTGMLGSAQTCRVLADVLPPLDVPVICDPVLASTSGKNLLEPEALDLLKQTVFPFVEVLTPNVPEAEMILGSSFSSAEDAAERLLQLGMVSVLIKGGHAAGDECRDFWTDGTDSMWLCSPRMDTQATHGTGCILASALASARALGHPIPEAVIHAKTFLNQSLKSPACVGRGHGPMLITPFRDDSEDRPTIR